MIPHKQLEAHQHTSVPDRWLTSHTSEQREKRGQKVIPVTNLKQNSSQATVKDSLAHIRKAHELKT